MSRIIFIAALLVVIAFQAAQRATNFALSNPAREVLFTVVGREEKYKAKNVIDIVVFRGADAGSGWLFSALRGLGLELATISLATVPIAANATIGFFSTSGSNTTVATDVWAPVLVVP